MKTLISSESSPFDQRREDSHPAIIVVPGPVFRRLTSSILPILALVVACFLYPARVSAQLFTNLNAYTSRLPVGDPSIRATNSPDGPKGIATADFNGDSRPDLAIANTDGSVTVYFNIGQGKFGPATHLQTGVQELRGIIADDLTGDGQADITVAAPYAGRIFLFANENGTFAAPRVMPMWDGARNLVAGDFNGDSYKDLVVAGTTNGIRQLRNLGSGDFVTVTNVVTLGAVNQDFPKPLYALGAFRPAGSARDELVVTHADSDKLWILAPGADGSLRITGIVTNQNIHAVATGSLLQPAASTHLDLITASRDFGTINVHRGIDDPARFQQTVYQRIPVPGGPRAISIVDLDGDGWNDVVVVLRNFDRVLSYHNSNGVLVATSELPVGRSPRELVSADFNGDGHPDVAVMNRDSMDISVLLAHPGQTTFSSLDQIYPVDGEVSSLSVVDFNRDGRDDVLQLHRASGEFSVRLAKTNGLLGEPTFYALGTRPSAQVSNDINGDGIPDLTAANLGYNSVEYGSISIRLGTSQGTFLPEQRFSLPPSEAGNLFALVAADFDNDGDIDLAAGTFDCRLAFFENISTPTQTQFRFTKTHRFVYESRVMVAGDFDKDGDIDLAGAGYAGDVVVIENRGDLLTTSTLTRTDYRRTSEGKFGTRDIVATDVNNDGDLDLLVGSGSGVMVFYGAEGMSFFRASEKLPGTDFPASAVAIGDFDGNGTRDVAVSCRVLSCISILTPDTNTIYKPALSVDVPSGEFLAAGDLDGDGQADLVGSGSVLWTALSSRRAQPTPATTTVNPTRDVTPRVVINEILAINSSLPLESDNDRNSDWVELYNAGTGSLSLNGWKLQLTQTNALEGQITSTFSFPPTAFLAPRAYLVIVFSEVKRTLYHTGFRLPGDGGHLVLLNSAGQEVDSLRYSEQLENVSYGRYRDGLAALASNPYPSPGRSNTDNGPVEPVAKVESITPFPPEPDAPIRFYVNGRDDVGIIALSVVWQRLDLAGSSPHRVILYDDGLNGDQGALDGVFSGVLVPGLPDGAAIQFYLEVTDLSGQTVLSPSDPVFASPGQPVTLHTLGLERPTLPVEISEVVAANENGLRDELGLTPDWLEIRNVSRAPVSLHGVSLGTGYFGMGSRYVFSEDEPALKPGEHRVIYCDGRPDLGPSHAPFQLTRAGDALTLTITSSVGARLLVDSLTFGPQKVDTSLSRLGRGGPWYETTPTPRQQNVTNWNALLAADRSTFTLVYPTTTNGSYVVQYKDALAPGIWTSLPAHDGDGLEHATTQELAPQRYYRVRRDPVGGQ
jgi:hypothetical protein